MPGHFPSLSRAQHQLRHATLRRAAARSGFLCRRYHYYRFSLRAFCGVITDVDEIAPGRQCRRHDMRGFLRRDSSSLAQCITHWCHAQRQLRRLAITCVLRFSFIFARHAHMISPAPAFYRSTGTPAAPPDRHCTWLMRARVTSAKCAASAPRAPTS